MNIDSLRARSRVMISMPPVENILDDPRRRVRFRVLAYRKLGENEMRIVVQAYLDLEKLKPEPESEVTIVTSIGFLGDT